MMELLAQFLPVALILILWEMRELRKDKQHELFKDRVKSLQSSTDHVLSHIAKTVAAIQEIRDQLEVLRVSSLSQKESADEIKLKVADTDIKLGEIVKEMEARNSLTMQRGFQADFVQGL